jgi:NADH:ubiquinone oxidoreductase subunit K
MGINYFIFISAVLFFAGMFKLLFANKRKELLASLGIMFTASLIILSASGGAIKFNPEVQILLFVLLFFAAVYLYIGFIILKD